MAGAQQTVWCRMAKLLQNQVRGVLFSFLWRLERRNGKFGSSGRGEMPTCHVVLRR